MPAKLLAIEGIDGSGKETQTNLLAQKLTQKGKKVAVFSFPRYNSFFGLLIKKYLSGKLGDYSNISPYYRALPYALDRMQAKKDLLKAIKTNDFVICNRYVPSNLAHQSVGIKNPKELQNFLNFVKKLEYKEFGLPKEDIIIFLDISVKTAIKLIASRQKKTADKDFHESNRLYLEQTRNAYLRAAKNNSKWVIISCEKSGKLLSKKEVHNLIIDKLSSQKILTL